MLRMQNKNVSVCLKTRMMDSIGTSCGTRNWENKESYMPVISEEVTGLELGTQPIGGARTKQTKSVFKGSKRTRHTWLAHTRSQAPQKEWWREWIQLWCIVRTLINVTVYSLHNNNMIIKNNKFKKNKGTRQGKNTRSVGSLHWALRKNFICAISVKLPPEIISGCNKNKSIPNQMYRLECNGQDRKFSHWDGINYCRGEINEAQPPCLLLPSLLFKIHPKINR
jgi:hypothetical protein